MDTLLNYNLVGRFRVETALPAEVFLIKVVLVVVFQVVLFVTVCPGISTTTRCSHRRTNNRTAACAAPITTSEPETLHWQCLQCMHYHCLGLWELTDKLLLSRPCVQHDAAVTATGPTSVFTALELRMKRHYQLYYYLVSPAARNQFAASVRPVFRLEYHFKLIHWSLNLKLTDATGIVYYAYYVVLVHAAGVVQRVECYVRRK